jgi:hypothetical protein
MSAAQAPGFIFNAPQIGTLWGAVRRFPFATAACLGFALLMIAENHGGFGLRSQVLEPLAYGLFAAFFATLALHLAAEAQNWPRERLWLACSLTSVLMVLWVFGLGHKLGIPHYLLGFALVGVCMTAPRFGRCSDEAFWVFNQQSYYGFAIGGIAVAIFLIGLSAVLWALAQLFDASGKFSFDITILVASVFWPVYAMSFIPRLPLVLSAPPTYPPALSFVLSFVALPVLLVYGAIITIYGVQVAFLGSTPTSSVSWMVIAFAAAGVALHTLLYPLRDAGGMLVRLYYRYFYYLLAVLLWLLFWAVLVRVRAYGVTENRYLAVLGGLWAGGLCLLWLLRGRFALWLAPATLAVLLVLASFGPWGAEQVAFRSQTQRLEAVLQQLEILQNGALRVDKAPAADWAQRRDLSSLLDFFQNRRDERMPRILQSLRDLKNNFEDGEYNNWQQLVMKRWGLAYIPSYEQRDDRSAASETDRIYYSTGFGSPRRVAEQVKGYDLLLPFTNLAPGGQNFVWAGTTLFVALTVDDGMLVLFDGTTELGRADVLSLVKDKITEESGSYVSGPVFESEFKLSGKGKARVRIEGLQLERDAITLKSAWRIASVTGTIFWQAP